MDWLIDEYVLNQTPVDQQLRNEIALWIALFVGGDPLLNYSLGESEPVAAVLSILIMSWYNIFVPSCAASQGVPDPVAFFTYIVDEPSVKDVAQQLAEDWDFCPSLLSVPRARIKEAKKKNIKNFNLPDDALMRADGDEATLDNADSDSNSTSSSFDVKERSINVKERSFIEEYY
ncbi:hypothetical protein PHJA_001196300 [Phtheirospermum japonicum]|uniref:Uncharacterized protein n=1 Tax=Phtheirospermum japonicum TaxID=374723 RepID=A0A830C2I5_9LAMI|nr:hypothetical protein PHJA_001196300 [Phtheirospermum japonicum]